MPRARNTQDADHAPIASAVRTIASLSLLSRIAGLARDVVTARVFRDSLVGSAFAAAFAIPNMFRRLLGEGALSAAFLPEYARTRRDNPEIARALLSLTLLSLMVITSLLTILGEGLLLLLLALDGSPERALSFRLVMVMLPLMPMVCATAILGAALQTHGRFAPSAGGPIILNACLIAAALMHFFGPKLDAVASAYAIGVAALIAGIAHLAWCVVELRRDFAPLRDLSPAREAARNVIRRFLPVAIGLGAIQINSLLDTTIAMWPTWIGPTMFGSPVPLDERSNAILTYTQRLYQFPLGVFGIAVATAAFPALARLADRPALFRGALDNALRLSLFIAVPATLGLVLVREDLTRVMFGGTSGFSDDGLTRSAGVLLGYSIGVWAFALNHVLVRGFYARGDTRTPMRIALAAVGLNLSLNLTLIWFLREAGLAWSTAIAQSAQALTLLALSRRAQRASQRGEPAIATAPDRPAASTLRGVVRIAIVSVAMGLFVWLSQRGVSMVLASDSAWHAALIRLAGALATGVVVYALLAWRLRLPELRTLLARGEKAPTPDRSADQTPDLL